MSEQPVDGTEFASFFREEHRPVVGLAYALSGSALTVAGINDSVWVATVCGELRYIFALGNDLVATVDTPPTTQAKAAGAGACACGAVDMAGAGPMVDPSRVPAMTVGAV